MFCLTSPTKSKTTSDQLHLLQNFGDSVPLLFDADWEDYGKHTLFRTWDMGTFLNPLWRYVLEDYGVWATNDV